MQSESFSESSREGDGFILCEGGCGLQEVLLVLVCQGFSNKLSSLSANVCQVTGEVFIQHHKIEMFLGTDDELSFSL